MHMHMYMCMHMCMCMYGRGGWRVRGKRSNQLQAEAQDSVKTLMGCISSSGHSSRKNSA